MLTYSTQELIGWPLGQKSMSSYSVSGLVMGIHYEAKGSSKGRNRNQMYLLLILSGLYVSLCGCNHSLTYGFCSCDDVLKDHLPFGAQVFFSERSFLLFIKIHILLKTQTIHVREEKEISLQEKSSLRSSVLWPALWDCPSKVAKPQTPNKRVYQILYWFQNISNQKKTVLEILVVNSGER